MLFTKDKRTPSQYRNPGHKISYDTTGVGDSYWNARCTCGWHSRGWTERKRHVVSEAIGHMHIVERDRARAAIAAFFA